MQIKVHVSVGLVGCDRSAVIEVDDDADDEEIEEQARDAMFDLISWHWERVDEKR